MFPFNTPLLLMCVGVGNTMNNANGLKICIEVAILTTPINLYTFNFGVK
jgi:hypothetical protein